MKLKWYQIFLPFLLVGIVILVLSFPLANPSTSADPVPPPRLDLSLTDITLSEILTNPKDTKYPGGTLTFTDGDESITFTDVELKGRGNSTWGWPKSPFQLKFNQKVDFLDMGAAKKWILLANYLDKSNLRNAIAFELESLLGDPYALEGRFVDLYIDGDYQGLYFLAEKVELAKNRINLKNEYAIIAELENLHAATESKCYTTTIGTRLLIHDLRVEDNAESAIADFLKKFNRLEEAAKKGDYETVKSLADTTSLAKYYLLSEFTVNPDAYSSSFFFYQDGPDDLVHAGPGWDFDLALGNRLWTWAKTPDFYSPDTPHILEKYALGGEYYDETTSSTVSFAGDHTASRLIFWLLRIPEFEAEVEQVYRDTLMNKKDVLLGFIKSTIASIRTSATLDRDLWRSSEPSILHAMGIAAPDLDQSDLLAKDLDTDDINSSYNNAMRDILHTDLSASDAFDLEADALLDWVSRRFDYLDREFSGFKHLKTHLALL